MLIGVFVRDASSEVFLSLSSFKRILRLQPHSRSAADVQFLVKFTAGVRFFQDLGSEVHYQCCQYMRYEFVPKGAFVFRKGDAGSAFYVILDGSCAVLVPNLLKNGELEHTEVLEYNTGDTFGELALLRNANRAASVKCKLGTHFAVLDKEVFSKIVAKSAEIVLESKVDFLAKIPFLASISRISLQKASYYFKEQTYRHRQEVFRAGEAVSHVYFIKEGAFEVLVTLPAASKSHYIPSYTRKVGLAVLTKEQVFGEEDVLDGLDTRSYTVVCDSGKGVLLVITKEDFTKRVCSDDTIKALKHWQKVKNGFRNQRLSGLSAIRSFDLEEKLGVTTDLHSSLQTDMSKSHVELRLSPDILSDRRFEQQNDCSPNKSTSRYHPSLSWDAILLRQQAEKHIHRPRPSHPATINIHTQKLHRKRPTRPIFLAKQEQLPPIVTPIDSSKLRNAEKDLYAYCS